MEVSPSISTSEETCRLVLRDGSFSSSSVGERGRLQFAVVDFEPLSARGDDDKTCGSKGTFEGNSGCHSVCMVLIHVL